MMEKGLAPEAAVIRKNPIFRQMTDEEFDVALNFLEAHTRNFSKGEVIFHAGQKTTQIGAVISGAVIIENSDVWGNRTVLTQIEPGDIFAETYALRKEPLLVDAVTSRSSKVLFLNASRLTSLSGELTSYPPVWYVKLLQNFLNIAVGKNLKLSSRSFHTASRSVRGRVMSYLNSIALQTGSDSFDISFDRQSMADYLNIDRSALSRELSHMQDDGLIRYRKNHFELLKQ